MTTKAEAEKLYKDLMDYVSDAREMTERGDFVELINLDERVKGLCEAVQNMSVEESMEMKDQLQNMMDELNQLQEMFVEKRDGLAKEITDMNQHKQAARAYKQQEITSAKEGLPQEAEEETPEEASE